MKNPKGINLWDFLVCPTGFEPAFSPAGSVGVGQSSLATSSLQSRSYQAVKEETQVLCGFQVHPTNSEPIWKTAEALGTPGLPRFFWFLENSSQTVVK